MFESITNKLKIGFILLLPAFWVKAATTDDSFSSELSYNHSSFKQDNNDTTSTSDYLSAQWYFNPIRTHGVPLAEAAFLNRSSSISALFSKNRQSSRFFSSSSHLELISATYANPEYPITISVKYLTLRFHPDNLNGSQSEEWGLGIGYYLRKGLSLSANYSRRDASSSMSCCDFYQIERSFRIKWVNLLSAQTSTAFVVNFSRAHNKNGSDTLTQRDILYLSGNYYFTQMASVGLEYFRQTEDDFDVGTYVIKSKFFVTKQLSLNVTASKARLESPRTANTDTRGWSAGFGYRF